MKSYEELYKMRIRGDVGIEVAMYAAKAGLELPYTAVQLSNRVLLTDVLREALTAEAARPFKMSSYAYSCGTPACAFGLYAASSLQDAFELRRGSPQLYRKGYGTTGYAGTTGYDCGLAQEHFGLDVYALSNMFCGDIVGRETWTVRDALNNIINALDEYWESNEQTFIEVHT